MVANVAASLEQHAMKAAAVYTRRNIVYIARRGKGGELAGHCSGSLWRTSGGLAAALTVKHFVTGHRSFTIGGTTAHQVRLRDACFLEHPKLDLAVLVLNDPEMANLALPVDALADVSDLAKGAPLLVSGFPKQGCFMDRDAKGEIKLMGDLTYFTAAAGRATQSISIQWKEAETDEATAQLFRKAEIRAGRHPMKKPESLSGGAAWLWRLLDANKVWSPSEAVKFVGVPYEFTNQRELALPVWHWREWFHEQLAAA